MKSIDDGKIFCNFFNIPIVLEILFAILAI